MSGLLFGTIASAVNATKLFKLLITLKQMETEALFLFQRQGLVYGESTCDIPDGVRFKMADWQPFLFNMFAHSSKTNRDIDFV